MIFKKSQFIALNLFLIGLLISPMVDPVFAEGENSESVLSESGNQEPNSDGPVSIEVKDSDPSDDVAIVPVPEEQEGLSEKANSILALIEEGKDRKVRWQLNKWLDEDKHFAEPYLVWAVYKFHEKNWNGCIRKANKALKLDPGMPEAYYWKGRAYEAKGKYLEAVNEYKAALFARDGYAEAQMGIDRVKETMAKAVKNSDG